MAEIIVSLPDDLRSKLKDPMGPVYTDTEALLQAIDGMVITVGDIVTYHLKAAGHQPDVSVIDGRTERSPVETTIAETLEDTDVTVSNPAAALTDELLTALRDAITAGGPVRIQVDGEEDLAVLPAILVAPHGASVVYGQPNAGMVGVRVSNDTKKQARDFVSRMDGDPAEAFRLLGVA